MSLLRDNELARRQEGRVELRALPLRVRWRFADLLTSDGHELRASFACSARAIPEPVERRMLEEVLLGPRYAVADEDLAAHFEMALRTAAARAAERHTAAEWADGSRTNELVEAIRSAAAPIAFGCGIELLPPFALDVESPTFERQRLRAQQQELAERQAAGQVEHVQRAAELLRQFQSIRSAAPELSPGRVLQQISPAEQGAVLQTLLMASARQQTSRALVWAVAGPYLVWIEVPASASDGAQLSAPQLLPLPPGLGPLRSVTVADLEGRRRLLVGARAGFMIVDPENPAVDPEPYAMPAIESSLGFSRVADWGARGFVASHGEAGIVQWAAGQPESPKAVLPPSRLELNASAQPLAASGARPIGPRNLQVVDDRTLAFSVGARVFATDMVSVRTLHGESAADVVALLPADRQVIAIHEDGAIEGVDPGSGQVTSLARRGVRLRAAGTLPWLGARRLLLAGEDGPVDCVGLDDPLITQYCSGHRGLRVVCGSAELIAAVSGDRQRLVLWHSWDGRRPLAELYLTGLTRHRIADVTIG